MARFDRIAKWYDRLNAYGNGETLARNLELEPGMRVLDVGGGTGQVADALGPSAVHWLVVDPSSGMHEERRKRRPRVAGILADGGRLPLRPQSVDRVVMVDALHHVPDQESCLREIRRVLRPEGRAVVEEFNWDHKWTRWFLGLAEKVGRFGSHFERPSRWIEKMEQAGFHVERVEKLNRRDVQFILRPRP